MAYKNGIEAKKDSTQRSERKTHSPREVLSLNPTRTNRNATANSAALTWNVILTIDSTKTEIEREGKTIGGSLIDKNKSKEDMTWMIQEKDI